ncbi:MAG: magnesium transporter [Rhizobiales bacterium]|nr:magnesium transporter [Hyphomicrobiales bacterium]
MTDVQQETAIRDEWGAIDGSFIEQVTAALGDADAKAIRGLTRDLHAADLADLIESLDQADRVRLITALGRGFDVEALAELDETVRDELMEALPNEVIASAIKKLDTDDALYLIEDLEESEQQDILAKVPEQDRAALSRGLHYPEETAGRLMQTEFVAVPEFWSIGKTIDFMRTEKALPESFVEIYVIDPGFHLKGFVPLSRLLRSPRDRKIAAVMDEEQTVFKVTDGQDEVAYKFKQYNLVSAAVTDEAGRLVGMLMVDDIVDVIHEEAEEDILHLGGVGDESISDTVAAATRSRFTWLSINLLTAVLASWVISWFDATLQQMVALAILMPVVASQGGNAATQTMTVVVRALATRTLGPQNLLRVTLRESAVGLINGLLFALIMGLFAWWWFGSGPLGIIIGAAMVINLMAAALGGMLIPVVLDRFDIDPAISSGAFVTTVTDVVGFFAFLGLASIWLV